MRKWIVGATAVLVFAAGLALEGCKQEPRAGNIGPDGYRFEKQDFERTKLTITVVPYDNRKTFEAAARSRGIKEVDLLMAFATYNPTKPECTVHIIRPSKHYGPQWIGHEFVHCIYGRFHGDKNRS